MKVEKLANKLAGWSTIDDLVDKLKIRRSTAYKYVSILNKKRFIIQKIKRPRGTMYQISKIPTISKHLGMYEKTEFVAPELEFSKEKITPEQKIAFFLSKYKSEKNRRYYDEALKLIRKIKNWKRLYKYLKSYNAVKSFGKIYIKSRKTMKKIPKIPVRYKKLIGVKGVGR